MIIAATVWLACLALFLECAHRAPTLELNPASRPDRRPAGRQFNTQNQVR